MNSIHSITITIYDAGGNPYGRFEMSTETPVERGKALLVVAEASGEKCIMVKFEYRHLKANLIAVDPAALQKRILSYFLSSQQEHFKFYSN